MMASEKRKAYETIILILKELILYRETARNIVLRVSGRKTMEYADDIIKDLIRHVRKYMALEDYNEEEKE